MEEIRKICTEFVNDPVTTSAIQSFSKHNLVKTVNMNFTKEQLMQALNIKAINYIVPIENIEHNTRGNMNVYVCICDDGTNCIKIGTKWWFLEDELFDKFDDDDDDF